MVWRLRLGILVCLVGAGCAAQYRVRRWEGPLDDGAAAATAERFPSADAVVLEHSGDVRFDDGDDPNSGFTHAVRMRVRILRPAARDFARVSVPMGGFTTLVSVAARAYDPRDPLGVRDLPAWPVAFVSTANALSATYGDGRAAVFDVPGVRVGDVLAVEIVTHTAGLPVTPGWQLDGAEPRLRSTYTVHVPAGWSLDHAAFQAGRRIELPPACEPEDGGQRCVWTATDVPAIEHEVFAPSLWQRARRISVSARPPGAAPQATWAEVGAWYRGLVAQLAPLGEVERRAIEAEAANLPGATAEERLFHWVRDRVRYAAVHDGIGAFQPHAPGVTQRHGWGDCKDMATLLVELLRGAGLTAFPALVASTDELPADALPSLGVFDHVIAAVETPTGLRFLDPTSKITAYGRVGRHLRGKRALVVLPDGVRDVTLPWATEGDEVEVDWTVSATNAVALVVRARGVFAARLTAFEGDAEARRALALGYLAESSGARVLEVELERRSDDEAVLRAQLALDPFLAHGAQVFGAMSPFWDAADSARAPEPRTTPAQLSVPGRSVTRVTWRAPLGAHLARAPSARAWESPAFRVKVEVDEVADGVRVARTVESREAVLPPDRASELTGYADALQATASEAVVWSR